MDERTTEELKKALLRIPLSTWLDMRTIIQAYRSSWDGEEDAPIGDRTRKAAVTLILWSYLSLTGHL